MACERASKSDTSPRFFSTEFKVDPLARLERGEPAAKLAREMRELALERNFAVSPVPVSKETPMARGGS